MTKSTALMGPTSESFPTRCSVKCDPCLPLHSSWPPSLTLTSSRLPLALYPAWRAPSDHESSLAKTRIPAVGGSASLRATTPPPFSPPGGFFLGPRLVTWKKEAAGPTFHVDASGTSNGWRRGHLLGPTPTQRPRRRLLLCSYPPTVISSPTGKKRDIFGNKLKKTPDK